MLTPKGCLWAVAPSASGPADYEQEQARPMFAAVGGYLEMYVLAALEEGRHQLQILHEFDSCCTYASCERGSETGMWLDLAAIEYYVTGVRLCLIGMRLACDWHVNMSVIWHVIGVRLNLHGTRMDEVGL